MFLKYIPTSKDSIALAGAAFLVLGFFIAGLCDVLDYMIIKGLLFSGFAFMFVLVITYAIKNDKKKNRLEDELQDDSH